jgi:hypothetical protein
LGTKPFSYALFAQDAFAVIRHETNEKVDVLMECWPSFPVVAT